MSPAGVNRRPSMDRRALRSWVRVQVARSGIRPKNSASILLAKRFTLAETGPVQPFRLGVVRWVSIDNLVRVRRCSVHCRIRTYSFNVSLMTSPERGLWSPFYRGGICKKISIDTSKSKVKTPHTKSAEVFFRTRRVSSLGGPYGFTWLNLCARSSATLFCLLIDIFIRPFELIRANHATIRDRGMPATHRESRLPGRPYLAVPDTFFLRAPRFPSAILTPVAVQ